MFHHIHKKACSFSHFKDETSIKKYLTLEEEKLGYKEL